MKCNVIFCFYLILTYPQIFNINVIFEWYKLLRLKKKKRSLVEFIV